MQNTPKSNKRILSVFSLVMINVIAVDSLRTLPIGAEYGFSLVFYYSIAALVFFIPIALVSAELATAWPATGGIYVWVRTAFGKRFGFLTVWLYWMYNVVWFPTILAFMATTLAYLIDPNLAENKTYMLSAILIMFWGATFINSYGMRASSWMSTVGALLGTIFPMVLIIILGAIWHFSVFEDQIQLNMVQLFPDVSNLNNLAFLIAVLFGLIGMEMSAVHAEEVKNPRRDYPRALLISSVIILTTLILSSLAIALVISHDQINLVSGLMDAFNIFFVAFNMEWMTPIIAILIIVGGICGVSAWIIGPTKGLLSASRDGSIPKLFEATNKRGAPTTLLLLQGSVFTLLTSLFLYMPTITSSYWLLSAMTAQLAMIVYILMFSAAIRLRYSHKHVERSYKIPGGNIGMWLVAGVGLITCCAAICIGFLPPTDVDVGNITVYESILALGIVGFCLPPFVIYHFSQKK